MIESITFPENGRFGYLYDKLEKPEKPEPPNTSRYSRYSITEEQYKEELKIYRKELAYWKKHKEDYALSCAKNLIGRTFTFFDKKINVIFGPNGSGKTTILKALSGNALASGGGFTRLLEPMEIRGSFDFKKTDRTEDIIYSIDKQKVNDCIVSWDGNPIYFDNFLQTSNSYYSREIGSLTGTGVLNSLGEEVLYRMTRTKFSSGENTRFVLNQLLNNITQPRSLQGILASYWDKMRIANDIWKSTFTVQFDYLNSHPKFDKVSNITAIFDEADKHLDPLTVWELYKKVFPDIVTKYGLQIILVTHNPLILTKEIVDNPIYNIISLDYNYTDNFKELLKGATF